MNKPYRSDVAMCLLAYVDATGESHQVWNSIDQDPDEMICLNVFRDNKAVWLQRDLGAPPQYAPDHKPQVGELVIIEHTPDVARFTACQEYDRLSEEHKTDYTQQEYMTDHIDAVETAGYSTFCIPATEKLCKFFRNLPR